MFPLLLAIDVVQATSSAFGRKEGSFVNLFDYVDFSTRDELALSCLCTQNCFPIGPCRNGSPPTRVVGSADFEQRRVCTEDLHQSNCLVYSFGIHQNIEPERNIAHQYGCEVHAFDPTAQHTSTGLLTFHKIGLQSGTAQDATNSNNYAAINHDQLWTLSQIRHLLGHENRSITLLIMDCEGCEWGVLEDVACAAPHTSVQQIAVEFHFQKNLGIPNRREAKRAANVATCLMKHWVITDFRPSGAGPDDWEYTPEVLRTLPNYWYLLNAAFRPKIGTERQDRMAAQLKAYHHARKPQKLGTS